MRFDRQKLEPFLWGLKLPAGSITLGIFQLHLNSNRLGKDWQRVLEEVVGRVR